VKSKRRKSEGVADSAKRPFDCLETDAKRNLYKKKQIFLEEVIPMKPGTWRLVMCGVSHKTSSLEEREPLQLSGEEMAKANALFGSLSRVVESIIVATCNRIEFYFVTTRGEEPFDIVTEFYQKFRRQDISSHQGLFLTRKGTHAVDHLFRVTAGIDSMVLGENQIQGQVKDAYSSACAVKSVGKVLHRLFHQAFRVGKQVRSDTEMGKGACSVSSAAVEMLKSKMSTIDRPSILFIGVNQMIGLAAGKLMKTHHSRFYFANRTVEKAIEFAGKFDGEGCGLEDLSDLLPTVDVVISCTSSAESVISRELVEKSIEQRTSEKQIVVDLAIPRDIDFPKGADPSVEICDLEDIKLFLRGQQEKREKAIPHAQEIVEQRITEFNYWFDHVKLEPIYNGTSTIYEEIRREELEPILSKLSPLLQKEFDRATRRLVERIVKTTAKNTPK
jgi:glutamyl-tRNA reductase